jgi:hypothetical protein
MLSSDPGKERLVAYVTAVKWDIRIQRVAVTSH